MGVSEQNIEQAFLVLRSRGYNFKKAGSAEADSTGLPWVPSYMLAVNKLETRKDIRDLDSKIAGEWFRGKDAAAFKARLEAIQRG